MIFNDMRAEIRRASTPALALYALFLLQSVLPGMVICYKEDGQAEIELVLQAAECHCESCEMSRHREAAAEAASWPAGTSFIETAPCRHESLHNEAGVSSSAGSQARSEAPLPAVLSPLAPPVSGFSEAPDVFVLRCRAPARFLPPDEGGLLRC